MFKETKFHHQRVAWNYSNDNRWLLAKLAPKRFVSTLKAFKAKKFMTKYFFLEIVEKYDRAFFENYHSPDHDLINGIKIMAF